eukprot:6407116-Pyramimonas_sp.AAC.1
MGRDPMAYVLTGNDSMGRDLHIAYGPMAYGPMGRHPEPDGPRPHERDPMGETLCPMALWPMAYG